MNVEQIAVADLIPYARNARTHSDAQVAQIAASIREFGFNNPVLIDVDSGIIAGHGRVLAARKLGMREVPCIRLGHLTDVQRRAYILADNKLALNAGWDEAMLALELSALEIEGFDLDLTGFDANEVDELMAAATRLVEKTETLKPIKWTRILISIPNGVETTLLTAAIDEAVRLGAEVDYAGN